MNSWIIDTHVHLHAHAAVTAVLARARENFAAAARNPVTLSGVLLLADMAGQDSVARLTREPVASDGRAGEIQHDDGVPFVRTEVAGTPMMLVSGYQVATRERLEVLALASRHRPADGRPLIDTLAEAVDSGAIAVLPWAVGKWTGARARMVATVLESGKFLGRMAVADNGNRPWLWSLPRLLTRARELGYPVLAGSDPLPLTQDEDRIGSMGVMSPAGDLRQPVQSLREILLRNDGETHGTVNCFGKAMGIVRFSRLQLGLRMRSR